MIGATPPSVELFFCLHGIISVYTMVFIYLYVCILVCWNVQFIHRMIFGMVKTNVFKNKIVTRKELLKAFLLCHCYTVPPNMFFFSCEASLVLKVTAKMYLICFQAERQSRRQLTSFFSRQMCVNYLDVIAFVMQRYYYRETDSYKSYGFFLDPFTHYHFVCYLHIYVQFI